MDRFRAVDDTALSVTDTRGPARPVIYLNGSYASRRSWRAVIAELGPDRRHVTYDERARGGSKRSSDYSFEACLRDVDAVVEATGVDPAGAGRLVLRRGARGALGLAARMSAGQHAEVGIEINEICAALEPTLDRLTCPVRYVLASGANHGGGQEEMEQMRASLDPVLRRKPNLRVSAKVTSNHTQILRKDFRAVAAAVRDIP